MVERGHLTLEGVVANEGDRRLANALVNSIPGVLSVTNNLRAESERAASLARASGQSRGSGGVFGSPTLSLFSLTPPAPITFHDLDAPTPRETFLQVTHNTAAASFVSPKS